LVDKQKTIKLKVSGMTCNACEQRIENILAKQQGVCESRADYSKDTVEIVYDDATFDLNLILQALEASHYPVVPDTVDTRKKIRQWIEIVLILAGTVLVYFLVKGTGVFNKFDLAEQNMALPVLFLIGVMTSVHCISMCGGINISQCAGAKVANPASKWQKLLPSALYNGGRIISYTVIGGIVGAIGSVIMPSGTFRGVITIVAGVFMLFMGLNMLNLFPFLRKLIPHLPKKLTKEVTKRKLGKGPFVVGLLNGFLPCGPLQAMQLYALSTGSFLMGALSMFLFCTGTVPLMFVLGAVSSFLSMKFTNVMMKVCAFLVILLGFIMLNSGLVLSGINPPF